MGRPPNASITVATRERLLDAALEAFAEEGLHGATLARIASAAGVTRPSLLHHFTTKEALYEATLQRAFSQLGQLVQDAIKSPAGATAAPFRQRLQNLVGGFMGFAEAFPHVSRLFLRSVVADPEPYAQQLLVQQAGPLLDRVEAFLVNDGSRDVRPGVDLRGGLLAIVIHILARAAAGPATDALWGKDRGTGDDDVTWTLLQHALLRPAR